VLSADTGRPLTVAVVEVPAVEVPAADVGVPERLVALDPCAALRTDCKYVSRARSSS
jgi:hypothetical protein